MLRTWRRLGVRARTSAIFCIVTVKSLARYDVGLNRRSTPLSPECGSVPCTRGAATHSIYDCLTAVRQRRSKTTWGVPWMRSRSPCVFVRPPRAELVAGSASAVHRFPLRLVHAKMNGISPVKCANLRWFAFIRRSDSRDTFEGRATMRILWCVTRRRNARLGVETTRRFVPTARSATYRR